MLLFTHEILGKFLRFSQKRQKSFFIPHYSLIVCRKELWVNTIGRENFNWKLKNRNKRAKQISNAFQAFNWHNFLLNFEFRKVAFLFFMTKKGIELFAHTHGIFDIFNEKNLFKEKGKSEKSIEFSTKLLATKNCHKQSTITFKTLPL